MTLTFPEHRGPFTFGELCELWLGRESSGLRLANADTERQLAENRRRLQSLCRTIGNMPLSECNDDEFVRAMNAIPDVVDLLPDVAAFVAEHVLYSRLILRVLRMGIELARQGRIQ